MKTSLKFIASFMVVFSPYAYAEHSGDLNNAYSQCVDQTIEELGLGNINNAVVEICSNKTKDLYQKQIVKLLDQIKKQSETYHQPERYKDIMKSQQLWKSYIDQECSNAGAYIGSPMYGFCPMIEYGKRVEQLSEYVN